MKLEDIPKVRDQILTPEQLASLKEELSGVLDELASRYNGINADVEKFIVSSKPDYMKKWNVICGHEEYNPNKYMWDTAVECERMFRFVYSNKKRPASEIIVRHGWEMLSKKKDPIHVVSYEIHCPAENPAILKSIGRFMSDGEYQSILKEFLCSKDNERETLRNEITEHESIKPFFHIQEYMAKTIEMIKAADPDDYAMICDTDMDTADMMYNGKPFYLSSINGKSIFKKAECKRGRIMGVYKVAPVKDLMYLTGEYINRPKEIQNN